MSQYEYGFEIESILKQFFALIDKSVVLRYEKVENERRLVQTITPFYKFATKSRALLLSLNTSKNFPLPCVVVQVKGIKADKERLAAKSSMINRFNGLSIEGYKRPTPISISVSVNIITKYKSDLFQIYGNLASQFQPECFISWMVPTNDTQIKTVEELRSKVEWDFNIDIDSKETLKEQDQDRFTGTMNFTIQGWMFHNHRDKIQSPILDIGTTTLVSNELETRIDGLIDHAVPLISKYGEVYKNPREWATSHIRILKSFVTVPINNQNYYFRVSPNSYNDYNLSSDRTYRITFDGYNLSKAKALLVPKNNYDGELSTIDFGEDSKIQPKIGQSTAKPNTISGIPLEIESQQNNTLVVVLPKTSYKGNFDIILYDEIDYDTFYNSQSFYFNATK